MKDVLADTVQQLTARRNSLARELATVDEAIAALRRVIVQAAQLVLVPPDVVVPPSKSAPAPGPPAAPPAPRRCALKTCGKPLPPPVRDNGRPRIYCDTRCKHRALKERHPRAFLCLVEDDFLAGADEEARLAFPDVDGSCGK